MLINNLEHQVHVMLSYFEFSHPNAPYCSQLSAHTALMSAWQHGVRPTGSRSTPTLLAETSTVGDTWGVHALQTVNIQTPSPFDCVYEHDDLCCDPDLQFSDRGRGSIKLRAMDRIQNKVTVWLMDTQGIEQCNRGEGFTLHVT